MLHILAADEVTAYAYHQIFTNVQTNASARNKENALIKQEEYI